MAGPKSGSLTIDARVAAFCEQFLNSARSYVLNYPTLTQQVSLGPKVLSVTVPDSLWGPLGNPLRGLRALEGEARPSDFEIILFHNAPQARLPVATWPSNWHYPLGQVSQDKTQRFRVAIDRHTATVSVFDHRSRVCAVWAYDVARLPYWWIATPFRLQFSWIADTFDGELVHAAAVQEGGRGFLLTGISGAGKSTLLHRLAHSGANAISDDFVLIQNGLVSSPYLRTKLHDRSLKLIPNVNFQVLNAQAESQKRILEGVVTPRPIAVSIEDIFLVQVSTTSTILHEKRARIFEEVALGTIPGVLGGSVRSFARLASLVKQSNPYRFVTSSESSKDVQAFEEFIRQKG